MTEQTITEEHTMKKYDILQELRKISNNSTIKNIVKELEQSTETLTPEKTAVLLFILFYEHPYLLPEHAATNNILTKIWEEACTKLTVSTLKNLLNQPQNKKIKDIFESFVLEAENKCLLTSNSSIKPNKF